jgi:hypothetical protein
MLTLGRGARLPATYHRRTVDARRGDGFGSRLALLAFAACPTSDGTGRARRRRYHERQPRRNRSAFAIGHCAQARRSTGCHTRRAPDPAAGRLMAPRRTPQRQPRRLNAKACGEPFPCPGVIAIYDQAPRISKKSPGAVPLGERHPDYSDKTVSSQPRRRGWPLPHVHACGSDIGSHPTVRRRTRPEACTCAWPVGRGHSAPH